MFDRRTRAIILPAILGSAVFAAPGARTGLIYVQAGVNGTYDIRDDYDSTGNPILPVPYDDYWNRGETGASAGGSRGSSSSSASASLLINPGIRLDTRSTPNLDESGFQAAAAQWRDVIRLSEPLASPGMIRVTIDVTGNYSADRRSEFSQDETRVYVSSYGSFDNGFTTFTPEATPGIGSFGQGFFAYHYSPVNSGLQVANARDFAYDAASGAISWKADFELAYDGSLGGYGMNLVFGTLTRSATDEDVVADFGSTFRLTAVTLADGSPVSGDVTFDSGFSLTAVPEPSSLTSCAIAGLCGLGYAWRRRKAARRAD